MAAGGAGPATDLLTTVGSGTRGVDELASSIPANQVAFGLIAFRFGSGTFARTKLLSVHIAPDSVPGIKKARVMGKKADVKKALGEVATELQIGDASELKLENLLPQIKHIAADSFSGSFTISQMKADYEAMIAAAAAAAGGAGGKGKLDLRSGGGRKTLAEMGITVPPNKTLEQVRERMGHFNWALFSPTEAGKELQVVNAGSLSVLECRKWLKDDEVCYGIVRMAFGTGRFRRVKHVFFSWSGPAVPVVKRVKGAAVRGHMKGALGSASIDLQVSSADELSLEAIISKIKLLPGIDGEADASSANEINVENYMKALEEEAKAAAEFFGDDAGAGGASDKPRPASEVIAEIRKGGGVNWGLFTVNV